MPIVAITQDQEAIGRAISHALATMPLDDLIRGRVVAVEPNETWASPDDIAGVTHGDTLRAVLQEVKRYAPSTRRPP